LPSRPTLDPAVGLSGFLRLGRLQVVEPTSRVAVQGKKGESLRFKARCSTAGRHALRFCKFPRGRVPVIHRDAHCATRRRTEVGSVTLRTCAADDSGRADCKVHHGAAHDLYVHIDLRTRIRRVSALELRVARHPSGAEPYLLTPRARLLLRVRRGIAFRRNVDPMNHDRRSRSHRGTQGMDRRGAPRPPVCTGPASCAAGGRLHPQEPDLLASVCRRTYSPHRGAGTACGRSEWLAAFAARLSGACISRSPGRPERGICRWMTPTLSSVIAGSDERPCRHGTRLSDPRRRAVLPERRGDGR